MNLPLELSGSFMYIFYSCVLQVSVCLPHVYKGLWGLEECDRSPGTGVTRSCEAPNMEAEAELVSFGGAVSAFSFWAIPLAPKLSGY